MLVLNTALEAQLRLEHLKAAANWGHTRPLEDSIYVSVQRAPTPRKTYISCQALCRHIDVSVSGMSFSNAKFHHFKIRLTVAYGIFIYVYTHQLHEQLCQSSKCLKLSIKTNIHSKLTFLKITQHKPPNLPRPQRLLRNRCWVSDEHLVTTNLHVLSFLLERSLNTAVLGDSSILSVKEISSKHWTSHIAIHSSVSKHCCMPESFDSISGYPQSIACYLIWHRICCSTNRSLHKTAHGRLTLRSTS